MIVNFMCYMHLWEKTEHFPFLFLTVHKKAQKHAHQSLSRCKNRKYQEKNTKKKV